MIRRQHDDEAEEALSAVLDVLARTVGALPCVGRRWTGRRRPDLLGRARFLLDLAERDDGPGGLFRAPATEAQIQHAADAVRAEIAYLGGSA